jgi:2-methylcitrate synthase
MAEAVRVKNIGLRGVTVADTKISFIDGEQGILIYRGYRIEELAEKSSFLETAYLLLQGNLPAEGELTAFKHQVTDSRRLSPYVLESLRRWPTTAHPMDVLQAAVPMLAMDDPDLHDDTREANFRKAIRLIARLPLVVASWHRIRQGLEPLVPDPSLSHTANFLWLLHGVKPDAEMAHDLDVCLVLHADHTFNASTFACREVISTQAHMYAAVAAGVGALSGSLHGGANAEVMRMLTALQQESDVAGWVRGQLDQGHKIMGMGHAVYKTTDPRARYLKDMCRRLGNRLGQPRWYELSSEIEETAIEEFNRRGKTTIRPNVDFYSAPVYHLMGIPGDLMTLIFAMARIAGWCAHCIEEKFAEAQEKPALYRPTADYVGHYCGEIGCTFTPVADRK